MKFESVTPNLIVSDIDRSTAFYRDVLGFEQVMTMPEAAPFVFVWLKRDSVDVFLNNPQSDTEKTPIPMDRPIAGTNAMYIKLQGLDDLAARVQQQGIQPAIPLHTEPYGMTEFAVLDPDGYLIVLAEPAQNQEK